MMEMSHNRLGRLGGEPMSERKHAAAAKSLTIAKLPVSRALQAERLLSLDVFRGITIAAMILVNNPGTWHVYPPLQHADWNGCTPTDLIFPFFLFIVGVAITFSFGQRMARGDSSRQLLGKILRRTLIIFGLGMLLNAVPYFDWDNVRIPGVLQRIALCYCVTALIVRAVGVRGQAVTAALLLIGYWMLMVLVPVAGHEISGLGPGTNLAAYIDDRLMHGHLLHHRWDPEGLLSTLPAIATTLSGVLTGHWLRTSRSPWERVAGLFVMGNLSMLLGLIVDGWFPINKNLWSSSYVLFTSGLALNCLGVCYWLIDIQGYRRWAAPFVIYGTNPILAYMLSSLVGKATLLLRITRPDGTKVVLRKYIMETCLLPLASPLNASLIYAVLYVLLWLGVTAFLYRKRIFIKI
jgi:predicted acyltransferase